MKIGFVLIAAIILFFWGPILLLIGGYFAFPERNSALMTSSAYETSIKYVSFLLSRSVIWANPLLAILFMVAILINRNVRFVGERVIHKELWSGYTLFVLAVLGFLLFATSDGTRYNTRFVFLPVTLACILAGVSTHYVSYSISSSAIRIPILACGMVGIVSVPVLAIWMITQRVDVKTPYEIAQFLGNYLSPEKKVLVLSQLWPGHPEVDPMEYSRIAAQSGIATYRILSPSLVLEEKDPERFIRHNRIQYIVEFSDLHEHENYLANFAGYIHSHPEAFPEIKSWSNARICEAQVDTR